MRCALLATILSLGTAGAVRAGDPESVPRGRVTGLPPADPPAAAGVLVIDPGGGPPRALIVVVGGRAYAVTSLPAKPPPPPDPPPPAPDPTSAGRFGLAALVRAAVATRVEQPADHRRAVARALAGSYRGIAAQAAAGTYATPEALVAANREAVRTCLGTDLGAWKPVLDAVKARLDELARAGTLATVADFGEAWGEIAAGLEGGD